MKVYEVFAITDYWKENQLEDNVKIAGVDYVEGRVFCEIYKGSIDKYKRVKLLSQDLLVPVPYSNIYIYYVMAQIALSRGEYELYKTMLGEYEKVYSEYARYYMRNQSNS